MSDQIPAKWRQFGHTRIDDILLFDLGPQSLCVAELNDNTSIVVERYQLPTTLNVHHQHQITDNGSPVFGSTHCYAVQFVLGELMFRIVQTLLLCL